MVPSGTTAKAAVGKKKRAAKGRKGEIGTGHYCLWSEECAHSLLFPTEITADQYGNVRGLDKPGTLEISAEMRGSWCSERLAPQLAFNCSGLLANFQRNRGREVISVAEISDGNSAAQISNGHFHTCG